MVGTQDVALDEKQKGHDKKQDTDDQTNQAEQQGSDIFVKQQEQYVSLISKINLTSK